MKSKFTKQLKNYSLLAGAVISSSSALNAQITYTNIDDVTLNSTSGDYNLDIDAGGETDFILKVGSSHNSSTLYSSSHNNALILPYASTKYIHAESWLVKELSSGQTLNSLAEFRNNVSVLESFTFYLSRTITTSTSIISYIHTFTSTTPSGGTTVFFSTTFNTVTNTITNTFTTQYSTGNFGGQGDKFIGVKFNIDGNTHYGWIRVQVSANANQLILKDYAYEATPETEIITGQIPTSPATDITVSDISDNHNGSDMQIGFTRISDESLASEYRIMVVKSVNAASFDLAAAEAVNTNFTSVNTGTTEVITLSDNAADTDGDLITEDVPYKIFILTIADGTNSNINALSDGSDEIILRSSTSAKTLTSDNFIIYPNPSNGIFNIKTKNTDNYKIEIKDINGKNVFSTAKNTNFIDISNNSPGIYYIKLITPDSKSFVKKIIIK